MHYRISTKKNRTHDLKIQKQISPTCLAIVISKNYECKCCQLKQKTRREFHKKVYERIRESKCGASSKFFSIKHPWNTSHIPYSELTRTLFPVESTNNTKIKIRHRRVIRDGFIWEWMSLMNVCWVSQCSIKF